MNIALDKYNRQRVGARHRGIEFNITFDEWYNLFLHHGVDKNDIEKISKDQLCLCRNNDCGPYSLDNVYVATRSKNSIDRNRWNPQRHNKSGKEHYKTRIINTPKGVFDTLNDAGKAFNVTGVTISNWTKTKSNDFYYID